MAAPLKPGNRTQPKGSGFVEISIVDTGRASPREDLERIFNLYFTTQKNGHGLGISHSRCALLISITVRWSCNRRRCGHYGDRVRLPSTQRQTSPRARRPGAK